MWVYHSAANAARDEGHDDVVQELETMGRFHRRRWESLKDAAGDRAVIHAFRQRKEGLTAWCCVTTDARIALGIEKMERKRLLFVWQKFSEEVERQEYSQRWTENCMAVLDEEE